MRLPLLSLSLALLTVGVLIQALELLTSPYDDLIVRERKIPTREEMEDLHKDHAAALRDFESEHESFKKHTTYLAESDAKVQTAQQVLNSSSLKKLMESKAPLNGLATKLKDLHETLREAERERVTIIRRYDLCRASRDLSARLANDYAHTLYYAHQRMNPDTNKNPPIYPTLSFEKELLRRSKHVRSTHVPGDPDTLQGLQENKEAYDELVETNKEDHSFHSQMASESKKEAKNLSTTVEELTIEYNEKQADLYKASDLHSAAEELRAQNFKLHKASTALIFKKDEQGEDEAQKSHHQKLEKAYEKLRDKADERIKNWGTTHT